MEHKKKNEMYEKNEKREEFESNQISKIRMDFKPTFKMDEPHYANGGECNGKLGVGHEANFKRTVSDSESPVKA